MAMRATKSSRDRKQSVSESSGEEFATSGDEDDNTDLADNNTMDSTSYQSSSDAANLSGLTASMDEGDENSPPSMVLKHGRRVVPLKQAAGAPCWQDTHNVDDSSMVTTHLHTETLVRRPLHRGRETKDSYIEYTTSQCTVISQPHSGVTSWNKLLAVALVLIITLCSVLLVLHFAQTADSKVDTSCSKSNISQEMFLQAFGTVRQVFPAQTSGFWGIIRAAVRPIVLQHNPDQPAVFVLVVPSDTRETATCFIRFFSDTVRNLFQSKSAVEFFTDAVSSLPPSRVKRLLDDQLRAGLASGSRVAIVHHLEQLHGESAMMLHAYCDNENAPFRRAIFILSLFVDETSSEVAETEAFVEERLRVLWENILGTNRFYPLITRIAHSIAFVRPDTADTLAKAKC